MSVERLNRYVYGSHVGYTGGRVEKLEAVRRTADILVGDFVLHEVLQDARNEADADSIERLMTRFDLALGRAL